MRVLVTGGAGYIGSHAIRALRDAGHTATVYDDLRSGRAGFCNGFPLVEADLADTAALERALAGVEAVMHFAGSIQVGESVADPEKYYENNLVNSLRLLNACRKQGVRSFVFSSTAAVYGIPERSPIPETAALRPINPYGATKLAFEQALAAYSPAYGIHYAVLRYFNAAGADAGGEIGEAHEPETHLIPLILEAAAGVRPELTIFGTDYQTPDGTCLRDYIHVSDLARAHVLALEYIVGRQRSVVVNLGTGRGHSVLEVIGAVEKVIGAKVPVRFGARREGDAPALVADPALANRELEWRANHGLEAIIESAWRWLRHRMNKEQQSTARSRN